ncbi:hypothetical protein Tco_1101787 [Tanacetum coccineum]
MSLIHAFSIEDMYSHEFSNSFQHTSFFQKIARKDSPVEVAVLPPKSKSKPTRRRQKRTIQNENAPWQIAWTNEEGIALCESWVHVSESSKLGNTRKDVGFQTKVIEYMENKPKQYGRRMYDMVNGKWKTRMESGAGDEDYYNMTLLHYEAQTRVPFKLRHCWEVLKGSPQWMNSKVPKFLTKSREGTKQKVLRRRKGRDHWDRQNEERKAFLKIKRKEVECRERELANQE